MDLEARNAHMVGGRLTASRHSSAATARRALFPPSVKPVLRLLPAAVQKSQVANMIPSDISLPLKTTINSRIKTICAMTELKPISARAVLTADAGFCARRVLTGCMGDSTRTELESSCL